MLSDNNISLILEAALGKKADFAEVFIEDTKRSSVNLLNNKVIKAGSSIERGIGIRVMSGVNSVYVFSNDFDVDALIKLASEASLAVNAGEGAKMELMDKLKYYNQAYLTTSSFSKTKKDYVDFLRKGLDHASNFDPMITQTTGSIATGERKIRVVNTRGVNIGETSERLRLTLSVVATNGDEKQTGHVSPGTRLGYSFIENYPIVDKATASVIGTVECCLRVSDDAYEHMGILRVDVRSDYEEENVLYELF